MHYPLAQLPRRHAKYRSRPLGGHHMSSGATHSRGPCLTIIVWRDHPHHRAPCIAHSTIAWWNHPQRQAPSVLVTSYFVALA